MADEALLALYLAKRANLVRVFAVRLRSLEAAEELIQELYLKLAGLKDSETIDNPSAFLFRCAANLMLDRSRQERRSQSRDHHWHQTHRMSAGGEDLDDQPSAEDQMAARQRLQRVSAIVEAMPPQMGRAFRLHKFEGLSHAETAKAMGISVSAVEKHISAGLKMLLKKLE